MRGLLAAAALGAIALSATAFARAAHHPAPASVQSSALLFDGRVRCSASIATPVRVGRPLRVRFRLHNLSDRPISITQDGQYDQSLVIKGSDGAAFDTRMAGGYGLGGPPNPTRIAPGETVASHFLPFAARWSGPLQITPGCGGRVSGSWRDERKRLQTLHVPVAPTAAPTSRRATVAAVVAASGHLLDHCRPTKPGITVDGVLDAPNGTAPPMHTRCSVTVIRERGFDLAKELIVTPAGLTVRTRQPYDQLIWPGTHGTWEAVAWEFVVTRDGAFTVSSDDIFGIKPGKHRYTPDWQWTRSGPKPGDGGANCRFMTGGSSGGSWGTAGPDIAWVSACQ